tara:strand:- start:17076 stop:17525 length:450 start_codon:yes stop_codon:yes gene_type:complete
MIDGVKLVKLNQIHDERGKVMHMLRDSDPHFSKFGEIYFSCTYPGVVKGWHKHKTMTLNYSAITGSVKVVLYDDRDSSATKGQVQEIFLSPENYYLLIVPPMIWNGFKAIGTVEAIVANCATIPHKPDEIERLDINNELIPYKWNIVHK